MTKSKESTEVIIGEKSLAEWDLKWVDVPSGFAVPHPEFNGKAGLFRAILHGETVAIGKAAGAYPCRLSKRLADFRRPGKSGRDHHLGELIHDNLGRLQLQVLITGNDAAACKLADELKKAMVKRHNPSWNASTGAVTQAAFG